MLVRFIKNWTLPLAMLAGTLGYFFFADIPFVEPAKPYVNGLVAFLTPLLIFSQLLLTFWSSVLMSSRISRTDFFSKSL